MTVKERGKASQPAPARDSHPWGGWWLLAGGLAVWALFVMGRHVKMLGLGAIFQQLWALYSPGRYPGQLGAGHMAVVWLGHLWHIAVAGAVTCAALGLGRQAFLLLRLSGAAPGMRQLIWLALGFGILALAQLGGGLTGLWFTGWPAGWIIAGLILSWPARSVLYELVPPRRGSLGSAPFKWLACGIACFIILVALAPEIFYDSLVYHTADPFNWAKVHKITLLPYNFFSNFPFAFEMLFGIGSLFRHDSIGRLLHAAISLTAAGMAGWLAFWAAGRMGFGDSIRRSAGWAAGAICLTTPLIANSAWMTGIDAGLILYETAAVAGVAVWWAMRDSRTRVKQGLSPWLILAAAMAGMGMGAKYTVGFSVGLLGLGIMLREAAPGERQALRAWLACLVLGLLPVTLSNVKEVWEAPWRESAAGPLLAVYAAAGLAALVWIVRAWGKLSLLRGLKAGALFGMAAWLFVAPWNIKSWLLTGNPVYPFAFRAFSSLHVSPPRMDYQMGEFREFGRRPAKDWLLHPLRLMDISGFSNNSAMGALFLALLPLVLVFRRPHGTLKFLGLVIFGKYMLWSNVSNIVRYFAPGLALLGVLISLFVEAACSGRPIARAVGRLAIAAFSAINVLNILMVAQGTVDFLGVVAGTETERSFFLRGRMTYPCPSYLGCETMNRMLPRDAGVLFLGEARGAFLKRRLVAPTVFDFPPLTDWCRETEDAVQVNKKLKQAGITHVFLNGTEARRTNGYGLFDWPDARVRTLFEEWWAEHLDLLWRAGELEVYAVVPEGVRERTAALKLVQVHFREYPELARLERAAILALQAGKFEAAERAARHLTAGAPQVAGNWEMLGHALANRSRPEEAIRSYRRAIELGLKTWRVYYNIATLSRSLGREQEAVRAYQAASEVELRWPGPR